MKTLAEITAWLKTPSHIRVVLVEVEGVEGAGGTLYLSSKPFATSSTDTPASTAYNPRIVGGVSFSESVSLDGSPSIGFGDIEFDNVDGSLDSWLGYTWTKKAINIYIGDPTWVRSDFRLIFSGVVDSVICRNRDTINLVIADKLKRLDTPITETKLGGTTPNADQIVPLTFGECFNVAPLLIDPTNSTYQIHSGTTESIIEVRDNGAVPVTNTPNLTLGTFTLAHAPYGNVTCSVQGYKSGSTYPSTVPDIIKILVTSYGKEASRFTSGEINDSSFTGYTQSVGIYITDNTTVMDACNQLASSIGCTLLTDSSGKLSLVRLGLEGLVSSQDITTDDMVDDSFQISDTATLKGSIKLGYCKNWSPQSDSLAAGIVAEHVDLYKREWDAAIAKNDTLVAALGITGDPEQVDTLLINKAEAEAEAARRLNIWSTQRYVVSFTGFSHLLTLELGTPVTVYHYRYGLNSGKLGMVVSIQRDWIAGTVSLGVLV